MKPFGMKKELKSSYEEALSKLPEALKSEGFGILTEIDIQETLKKKLGVDFRRYKIFGACNPPLAYRALSTELEVGLLLPCNVILYETDSGKAVLSVVDPMATIASQGSDSLREVARTVQGKLQKVLAHID